MHLVHGLGAEGPGLAAIESMSGARFVHDQLELAGWDGRSMDARRVKGLAPLACKTGRIDAWVLAELARRDLLPEVWLPDPAVRAEPERGRPSGCTSCTRCCSRTRRPAESCSALSVEGSGRVCGCPSRGGRAAGELRSDRGVRVVPTPDRLTGRRLRSRRIISSSSTRKSKPRGSMRVSLSGHMLRVLADQSGRDGELPREAGQSTPQSTLTEPSTP